MAVSWAQEALAALETAGRRRYVRALQPVSPVRVRWNGHSIRLFSGNDYLGLSAHPRVKAALVEAGETIGMGPRGSALICGYTAPHDALERSIAALKQTEAALVFPTGYAANLGLLTALGSENTAFFSDALNHASIIDGCRLAKGAVSVYRHRDPEDLRRRLRASDAERKVIVTDTVFSMEGTCAPLEALAGIAKEENALLVVDEAHATLVLGDRGGGLVDALGLADSVDFQVGTLSKAVGALGGYVATTAAQREWLLNTARSYIFSTALPVPIVVGAQAAITEAVENPAHRLRLWDHMRRFGDAIGQSLTSPIASLVLGEERTALDASVRLMEAGFYVSAIRPPTVPEGTCRLRIALSALHTDEDIGALVDAMQEHDLLNSTVPV